MSTLPSWRQPRARLTQPDDTVLAFLYTRVSTDDQGREGLSLPNQARVGRGYIADRRMRLFDEYQDVQSGKRDDRADYQRMLRDLRGKLLEGYRCSVVVSVLDRLGRRLAERVRAWDELKEAGSAFHAVDKGGEVDELTYNVLASVAQEESRRTSQRVRDVIQGVEALGWHPVGQARWGYRWRPATAEERAAGAPKSVLEPHPDEVSYVRETWYRVEHGESLNSVARWASGLPSVARGGRSLNLGAVRQILRAPVYLARPGDDREIEAVLDRPVGRWEALVSDETWLAVRRNVDRGGRLPSQASGKYLLTGLLRCYRCGERMAGRTQPPDTWRPKGRRSYVCIGWGKGALVDGETCRATLTAETIDASVIETLGSMLDLATDPGVRRAVAGQIEADARARAATDESARIELLEREIRQHEKVQTGLTLKFALDEITKEQHDKAQRESDQQVLAARTELNRLTAQRARSKPLALDRVLEQLVGWHDLIDEAWRIRPQDVRASLAEFIERIQVVKGERRGEYRPHFDLTETGKAVLRAAAQHFETPALLHVEHYGLPARI
jgi:DNA invertase Pin-like site-specific DNA recombinase